MLSKSRGVFRIKSKNLAWIAAVAQVVSGVHSEHDTKHSLSHRLSYVIGWRSVGKLGSMRRGRPSGDGLLAEVIVSLSSKILGRLVERKEPS